MRRWRLNDDDGHPTRRERERRVTNVHIPQLFATSILPPLMAIAARICLYWDTRWPAGGVGWVNFWVYMVYRTDEGAELPLAHKLVQKVTDH